MESSSFRQENDIPWYWFQIVFCIEIGMDRNTNLHYKASIVVVKLEIFIISIQTLQKFWIGLLYIIICLIWCVVDIEVHLKLLLLSLLATKGENNLCLRHPSIWCTSRHPSDTLPPVAAASLTLTYLDLCVQ